MLLSPLSNRRRWLRAAAIEGSGQGLTPAQMAALYGLRTGGQGAGQCIGLIHPAGGYSASDLAAGCAAMGVAVPRVIIVPVGAGRDNPGQDAEADKEVALDLQIAVGVASAATFVLYFADDSEQGLAQAVAAAVHDTVHRPSVLVTSWGDSEANWSQPARASMDAALADAARLGVTFVAATGDALASNGLMDGRAHVDYPASSPLALACGGTRATLTADGSAIAAETVWNDNVHGTGGGISELYPVPAYQSGVALPPSFNDGMRRRGIPDISAAASADPGYRIFLHGQALVIGGTSAVAPMFGAFLALINEKRRSPLGLVHDRLYSGTGLFRPVTDGDNRPFGSPVGYDAAAGWSACCGLGTPIGEAIVDRLTDAVTV